MPAIAVLPPLDYSPMDRALEGLDRFDWLVLTSVNGVAAVRARMEAMGIAGARFGKCKIAAIGPATARASAEFLKPVDLIPREFISEAIVDALPDIKGRRFLLARADIARGDLANILRHRGAVVEEVTAYRIALESSPVELPEAMPDYIALTSSSAVTGTDRLLRALDRDHWLKQAKIVCIGPITARTVTTLGYKPAAIAAKFTIQGVLNALIELETDARGESGV